MSTAELQVFADPSTLADHVAQWLLDLVLATSGPFAICLSGGRTPEALYRLLADDAWCSRFPWQRLHWFFGDERFVPSDDERSNYHMVSTALFARAPVPAVNIHAIPTEGLTPEVSALAYTRELQAFYGHNRPVAGRPLFDVNFLGLGADGHTASLFPGDVALDEHQKWVCAVVGAQPETRITLTFPVLASARYVAFLVTGAEKTEVLQQLQQGDQSIPAARLHPEGNCMIFADAAAAGSATSSRL